MRVDNLAAPVLGHAKVSDDKGLRRRNAQQLLLDRDVHVLAVVGLLQLLQLLGSAMAHPHWLWKRRRGTSGVRPWYRQPSGARRDGVPSLQLEHALLTQPGRDVVLLLQLLQEGVHVFVGVQCLTAPGGL